MLPEEAGPVRPHCLSGRRHPLGRGGQEGRALGCTRQRSRPESGLQIWLILPAGLAGRPQLLLSASLHIHCRPRALAIQARFSFSPAAVAIPIDWRQPRLVP